MNLVAEVLPGSTNEKVLNYLRDGKRHSHKELREECGLHKNQVSAALHRLRYYYGYLIEFIDLPDHVEYRLTGRTVAARAEEEPLQPPLGMPLTVVGLYLTPQGSTQMMLRSDTGTEWTVLLAPASKTADVVSTKARIKRRQENAMAELARETERLGLAE